MSTLTHSAVAILGCGKMGEILLRSLLHTRAVQPDQVTVTAHHADRLAYLRSTYGVQATVDNAAAAKAADVLLLCVKPQTVVEVLDALQHVVDDSKLLVSIVASVSTRRLEQYLRSPVPVVRAMPNTPCLVGKGMTVLSPGRYAQQVHLDLAESIFRPVGRTLRLDEIHMDAVTGLSASGPAFIYVVIESMAEGGVKVGLPRSIATELAAQAVLGAAAMVLETGEHPALLKDAVTTPAGCTIDGLMELEDGGLRVTLIKTVVRATQRAAELFQPDERINHDN